MTNPNLTLFLLKHQIDLPSHDGSFWYFNDLNEQYFYVIVLRNDDSVFDVKYYTKTRHGKWSKTYVGWTKSKEDVNNLCVNHWIENNHNEG